MAGQGVGGVGPKLAERDLFGIPVRYSEERGAVVRNEPRGTSARDSLLATLYLLLLATLYSILASRFYSLTLYSVFVTRYSLLAYR